MKPLAAVLIVALAASSARAESSEASDGKSETVATALTVTGIVVPAVGFAQMFRPGVEAGDGMFMLGTLSSIALLPGPALGHWYTGHVGTYGMLMRFGGFVFLGAGFATISDAKRCARGEMVTDGCDGVSKNGGRAMVGLGAAAVVGSWVYDVVTARQEARPTRRVQFVPFGAPGSVGLALGGSF